MTRNQIEALKHQEEVRHNKEQELVARKLIPAQYISAVGSLARGTSGFIKGFSGNNLDASNPKRSWRARQSGMDEWTLY